MLSTRVTTTSNQSPIPLTKINTKTQNSSLKDTSLHYITTTASANSVTNKSQFAHFIPLSSSTQTSLSSKQTKNQKQIKMRKTLSLRARASVEMAEFNTHTNPPAAKLSPPPLPPSPAKCDARKCPWWPYTNSDEFKANTTLILVVLFCSLICALALNAAVRFVIRVYCTRRRSKAEDGGGEVEMKEEVPTVVYTEGLRLNGADSSAECVICLTEFQIGDKIRVLEKCNHGFHVNCVQQWLVMHSSCPTCRTSCTLKYCTSGGSSEPGV